MKENETTDNPIKRLIKAKIATLKVQFNESSSINHNPTKGTLREQYLKELIIDLMPDYYLVKSGFLACAKSDMISPQIDLVIANKHSMPRFELNKDISVIPIESALLVIEIKSQLCKDAFTQIAGIYDVTNKFQTSIYSRTPEIEPIKFIMPSIIIAYDTDINIEKMREHMENCKEVAGVCIIGKYCLTKRIGNNLIDIKKNEANYEETLHFFSVLYDLLDLLKIARSGEKPSGIHPLYSFYLK
ncbi:MAG: hypothetical protein K9M75_03420 [Phycisphaerae bacterium]|nr:hypothetical protein [Phycisphaerae bacterium]